MSNKKQSNQYPIYFKDSKYSYYCLINEKESIQIGLYGHSNSIQHNNDINGTWVHKLWKEELHKGSKAAFLKTLKEARKILKEKLNIVE